MWDPRKLGAGVGVVTHSHHPELCDGSTHPPPEFIVAVVVHGNGAPAPTTDPLCACCVRMTVVYARDPWETWTHVFCLTKPLPQLLLNVSSRKRHPVYSVYFAHTKLLDDFGGNEPKPICCADPIYIWRKYSQGLPVEVL